MTTMTRDRGHSNKQFIYRFAYIFIYYHFIYQVGQYMQRIYIHFLFLFFFYDAFFLFFSICYHIVYIHPSKTKYIYIFNLIVHANYFEAFFIIGLRFNSISSTQLQDTVHATETVLFFSKCLFSLYFYRHHRLTHTRL